MTAKSAFLGLIFVLSLVSIRANNVPSLMSYQGRVTDASGTLIGNAGAVNRTVTFRFYASSSGGSALYAETQTVTISGGEFSVLIGNGTGVSGSPGPSSPATTPYQSLGGIVNALSGSALYLGITIDDGNGATVDAEIAPRQQIVSGAFALRAQVAESVVNAAVTSGMIADGAVNTNQIRASSVTSAKIADGSIATADIGNSVITSAKIDTNSIGLWNPSGANVYRTSGYVGIGESNPRFPLNFDSQTGSKISLYGHGSNHFGLGIQNHLLQLYTSNNSSDIAFGYGSSASMTETFRIRGNGNVGIGNSNPVAKLDIGGGVLLNGTAGRNHFKDSEKSDGDGLRVGAVGGKYGIYAETGAAAVAGAAGSSLQFDSLFVSANGNVGIGTTTPASTLSLRETTGSTASKSSGTLILDHGNNGGASSIVFRSSTNAGSDYGYIQYQDDSSLNGAGESARLIIGTQNDADDDIHLMPSGRVGVKTSNTSQADFNVGGSIAAIGSNRGSPGYARMSYESGGRMVFDVYNTYLNNGQWRGFSYDGDSNLDWRSDSRLKTEVEGAEPMLERVMQVQFHRFHWIGSEDGDKEFGVIAQELQPLFPDLIGRGEDGYYTVGYTSFGTIACKAIQELKTQSDLENEALSLEIESAESRLRAELSAKDAKIANLEKRLAALEQLLTAAP